MEIDEKLKINPSKVEKEILDFIQKIITPREIEGFVISYKYCLETLLSVNIASKVVGKENVKLLVTKGRFINKQPRETMTIEAINTLIDLPVENVIIVNKEQILREINQAISGFQELKPGFYFSDSLPGLNYNLGYFLLRSMAQGNMEEKTFASPEKRPKTGREKFIQKTIAAYKSQIRLGALLAFNLAESENYSVIGIVNKSEWLLGLFTKFGTFQAADILPLADLYRTQVVQLAEYLGFLKHINSTLTPGSSDFHGIFNVSIEEIDRILIRLEEGYEFSRIIEEVVVSEQIVKKIAHFYNVSQYARKVPLIPKF
ncbi:hypothetical protein [Candidatus Hodarchaeum mangrovi]